MKIEWRDISDSVGEKAYAPYGVGVAEGASVTYDDKVDRAIDALADKEKKNAPAE